MIYGLDLFSGIGGLTLALAPWVKPVAYCENDRFATGVLLSRMSEGSLPVAPIWDDVRTLKGSSFLNVVNIIYGGFPCQDISVAGLGKGLAGQRSGLFFEIMRLVDELQPKFIFLENVPAITYRGLGEVTAEITKRRYDRRWTTLSAAEVGAPHKRERWWLLAYSRCKQEGASEAIRSEIVESIGKDSRDVCEDFPNTDGESLRKQSVELARGSGSAVFESDGWWTTEPDVGRVANGVSYRVDRLRGLGNSVVPQCAQEAFKELMGIE